VRRSNALRAILFCSWALSALGCGQKSEQAPATAPKIFSEQREVLEKAKSVQDTVDQQAQQAQQHLDAAENGAKK
jgi:hypothetical protein